MPKPKLIAVLGPTASGKTDLGIALAKQRNGEIVSADSRQVYTGMDIGTAKVRDTGNIPHHLIDMREPNEPMSLAEWQQAAFQAIDDILARKKQPILVGGTMLYIDSVIYNFDIPQVTPDPAWRAEKETASAPQLYAELLEKDPAAEKFIEPKNIRRIIRALEVMKATGKSFSEQRKRREPKYDVEILGLFPSFDELQKRIEIRVKNMFAEGLVEEMAALRQKYGKEIPLLKTMNYRQAGAVLDGTMSQEEATADMIRDNMRYAHRQMSWWKERRDIRWVTPESFSAKAQ